MQDDHKKDCDCYDCVERTAYNDHTERYGEDDSLVSYYLDSNLVALRPVKIWTNAGVARGGKVKKMLKAGDSLGYIYSWVKDKYGSIWLQLSDKPNGQIIGYTPMLKGYFDKGIATATSSGLKTQKAREESERLNLKPPSFVIDFFGKFKWTIIIVLLIILTAVFLRIKG